MPPCGHLDPTPNHHGPEPPRPHEELAKNVKMERYVTGLEGARVQKRGRSRRKPFARSCERKYFDTYNDGTSVPAGNDWTGTELDPAEETLFAPSEGTDLDRRIGRRVEVLKIQVRGQLVVAKQSNQTASDEATVIRLILAQDKQTNGVQMQGEDLMSAPGSPTAFLTPLTMQNPANFGRFEVLKDKTFTIENPNAVYDGTNDEQQGLARPFKWTIKFPRPVEVRFNSSNGGTVADIINNSFHIIGCRSTSDLTCTLYYQCRVVYQDA